MITQQYNPAWSAPYMPTNEIIPARAHSGALQTRQAPFWTHRNVLVKVAVDSVDSPRSQRNYSAAVHEFLDWCEDRNVGTLTKALVQTYKQHLAGLVSDRTKQPLSSSSINLKLSAVRTMVREVADNHEIAAVVGIDDRTASSVSRVKGAKNEGTRAGNWLNRAQAERLLNQPDTSSLKGLRDAALLAVLVVCGLRREEATNLTVEHVQQRDDGWWIVDIKGKRDKIRSIPIFDGHDATIRAWMDAAGIASGPIFLAMRKGGKIDGGRAMSTQAIWDLVRAYCAALGFGDIAPHDLRRSAAKLWLAAGAPIEQISKWLGHESITTTQRYLGVDLDWSAPAKYHIGLKAPSLPVRMDGA